MQYALQNAGHVYIPGFDGIKKAEISTWTKYGLKFRNRFERKKKSSFFVRDLHFAGGGLSESSGSI